MATNQRAPKKCLVGRPDFKGVFTTRNLGRIGKPYSPPNPYPEPSFRGSISRSGAPADYAPQQSSPPSPVFAGPCPHARAVPPPCAPKRPRTARAPPCGQSGASRWQGFSPCAPLRLLLVLAGRLLEQADNRQVLRAHRLAGTALDAVRRLDALVGHPVVLLSLIHI